jgi:hypothetical protein
LQASIAKERNMSIPKAWSIAVATMAGGASLFVSDTFWTTTGPAHFTTQAEAVIGRPLTPFSVAGVARRTTRRAVAAGYYGHGYRSYGYGYGGYGDPYSYYGYANYGSSYPSNYGYANYGSSYPSSYGYANYGTTYPSSYGYANYGSSYGSTNYGSSYPYNYGYSDNRFPLSNLELWCFPPTCDRSRFDEKNAPQSAVPWAGQSLVQRSATPLPVK